MGGRGMAMKVWLHYMLKKESNQSKEKKVNEFTNTTSMEYSDARPFRFDASADWRSTE